MHGRVRLLRANPAQYKSLVQIRIADPELQKDGAPFYQDVRGIKDILRLCAPRQS